MKLDKSKRINDISNKIDQVGQSKFSSPVLTHNNINQQVYEAIANAFMFENSFDLSFNSFSIS